MKRGSSGAGEGGQVGLVEGAKVGRVGWDMLSSLQQERNRRRVVLREG